MKQTEEIIKEIKLFGTEIPTPQEQRFFLFLISQLDPNNPEDITLRIPISKFAKAIGVENQCIYTDVKKAINRFINKTVSIERVKEEGSSTINIPILGYAEYWHGKGYADIKFSTEVLPYLFELKCEFTQYEPSKIVKLSSIYAVRIYEILKNPEFIGKRTFSIDDLRTKLLIKEDKYENSKDLKAKVLEIAKREINAKTDLEIDFKFIKDGRKFAEIEFDVQPKNKTARKGGKPYCVEKGKDPKLFKRAKEFKLLISHGFSETQALDILDHADAVAENIKKQEAAAAKKALKAARKALEENKADKKRKKQIEEIMSRGFSEEDAAAILDHTIKNQKAAAEKKALEEEQKNQGEENITNVKTNNKKVEHKTGFMKAIEHFFRG